MSKIGHSTKPKPSKNKEIVSEAIKGVSGKRELTTISSRNQRRLVRKLKKKAIKCL